jgi:hypothetical protein
MKKYFALMLGLSLMFVSCSEDEGTDETTGGTQGATLEENIEGGTWELTKMEQLNGTLSSGALSGTYTAVGSNYQTQMNFNGDGSYTSAGSYDMTMTITYFGQSFDQSSSVNSTASGSWEVLSNGDLRFTNDLAGGESQDYEVISQSSTKLELYTKIESTTDFQGQTATTKADVYMTLEK